MLPCLWYLQNFKNFSRFLKYQDQNVFQVILSNFDFLTTDPPPPPPPTITTEKEITPDLAECKVGPKKHFYKKNFLFKFL